MTLGSLFDGIGGFPLFGAMHGITPLWASEIEPFPIAVTKKRFPDMTHLGSVTDINGAEIPKVDIITFGSPCQDLSVAGAQKGIHDGARSSLFFEAVRIIKEMRASDRATGRPDEHCRPRFAVWENVPGAFSSNKGRDFQAVLQALCEVADPEAHVPFPGKGKWAGAGCIVGDGYSVAWRVYDAQYWGVPQRRKRIYLVADFASERAGEILFESEGVRGDSAQGGEAREGTPEDAEGSAGRSSGVVCLNPWDSQTIRQYSAEGVFPALSANNNGGGRREGVCAPVGFFMGGQGSKAGSIAYNENLSPTLRATASGSNQIPDVVYPVVARTLTAESDASPCIDRGQNVICIQGNVVDREAKQNGMGVSQGVAHTVNVQDRHAVAFDCRNMVVNDEASGTLQAKNQGGYSLNFINPVVYENYGFGKWREGFGAVRASGEDAGGGSEMLCAEEVYPSKTGALCANSHPGSYTGQDAFNDMLPVISGKPPRKYIVRRLTPLECCRLQGYPDGWTENVGIDDPTQEEIDFFEEVWKRWAEINGVKPKNRSAVVKWLQNPGSDSAEYKAYGNSLAIPCSSDVLGRIARFMEGGNHEERPDQRQNAGTD